MKITPSIRISGLESYYFIRKLAEIDTLNKIGKVQVINLGIGSPDLPPPPKVTERLKASLDTTGASMYQSYKGLPMFRNAWRQWYQDRFEVKLDSDKEILPLMGSKEGVMHISMAMLERGDEVLVPNPGYPSYTACTKLAGATPIDMPLYEDLGWKPDLDKLSKLDLSRVKMMWLNYPNMPTGALVTADFFKEVVEWAIEHHILIVHDNPYVLLQKQKPLSIFNAPRAKECCIELMSLSKSYNMAGWRVGAVAGDAYYIDNILKFKSQMDSGMFRPVQEAASEALDTPQIWLDDLNAEYEERKIIAAKIFNLLDLGFKNDGGGLFLWGKIPQKCESAEALSDFLLHEAKVFITPGHVFGSEGERYLRISLCSPKDVLVEAYERISNINSEA